MLQEEDNMNNNQYYNLFEFRRACSFINTNPLRAKELFEEYFEKYPNDLSSKPYYIYTLIILGKLEEAKANLEQLKIDIYSNPKFYKQKAKLKQVLNGIQLNELRILARERRYQEFYDYLRKTNCLNDDKQISLFYRKKLGLENHPRNYNSYILNQIIEFHEEDFLDHIKKHTADYNKDFDYPNLAIFSPDFPLEDILTEIKNYIPSDKHLWYGFFEDAYIFYYPNCGRVNHKLVDYFKVVCFDDNDCNLITMYPAANCDMLPATDLSYINQEDKPKVKTLSPIEKFNRRYRNIKGN